MTTSKNVQIVVFAFANVLLAFACGMVFAGWLSGRTPVGLNIVLPFLLLMSFTLLATVIWRRKA